jgi:mono/diheme cytochrome c family protein
MKRTSIALLTLAALAATPALAAPDAKSKALVERGDYLVRLMLCNDCHTPLKMGPKGPEPDLSRLLSGHPQDLVMPPAPALGEGPWVWVGSASMTAFSGPWGTTFSANLTPDPETGIGNWTLKTFTDTIRSGRHEGQGRPLLPPMPFQYVAMATDDDLKAIFEYLRSIPKVKNRVPQPIEPPESR